jgi:hypothetical protein
MVDLSQDWDFRGRNGAAERHLMAVRPALINGRIVSEDLVTAAAAALGLAQATPIPNARFSHLVVLSGQVAACVNRIGHAARLLRAGLQIQSVTILTGHRQLAGDEPAQVRCLGHGDLCDEADAVLAVTRDAFDRGEPDTSLRSGPTTTTWDGAMWGESGHDRWGKDLEVVIAPSAEPRSRRASTVDQLRYWAEVAGIDSNHRVLLVTTQIYVPFQQLAALRWLGLERGCGVYCCGVDGATATLPLRAFNGREYLQEIRSALLAARELVAAAQQAGG